MPSVAAFKDGFNVKAKSKVGRFIIKTNKTGHDVIDNFVKYEFPMKIVLFIENPKEDDAGTIGLFFLAHQPLAAPLNE